MTPVQQLCALFVGLVMLGAGFWWLNEQLRPPTVRLARDIAEETSRNDLVALVLCILVWGSCATCGVVESRVRLQAYKACIERFSADECVAVKP